MKSLSRVLTEAFINEDNSFTVFLFADNRKTSDAVESALIDIDIEYKIDGTKLIVSDAKGYTPKDVQYYLKRGGVLSTLK